MRGAHRRRKALEAADLRFGQVGIANVRVRSTDPAALRTALEIRVREAPALFERAPVVVDVTSSTGAVAVTVMTSVRVDGRMSSSSVVVRLRPTLMFGWLNGA